MPHSAVCVLAGRHGLDEKVAEPGRRIRERRDFIAHLVEPTRSDRGGA